MKLDVNYWKHIILSGKTIEPENRDEQASYEIAEYLVSQKTEIAA